MDYVHIGKIVAAHGVAGEIILKHALGKKANLAKAEALFVEERKGSYVPWFVSAIKAKSEDEMYVKLEGVDNREATAMLISKQAWLTNEDFRKLAVKSQAISMLGYAIIEGKTTIGIIEEVIEQPHQILLRTTYKNNEALIPLHQETLKGIDHVKKQVIVELPDGLLELYAEG